MPNMPMKNERSKAYAKGGMVAPNKKAGAKKTMASAKKGKMPNFMMMAKKDK